MGLQARSSTSFIHIWCEGRNTLSECDTKPKHTYLLFSHKKQNFIRKCTPICRRLLANRIGNASAPSKWASKKCLLQKATHDSALRVQCQGFGTSCLFGTYVNEFNCIACGNAVDHLRTRTPATRLAHTAAGWARSRSGPEGLPKRLAQGISPNRNPRRCSCSGHGCEETVRFVPSM